MRFAVGLFVLAGLILLAVLATMFGHVTSVLRTHDAYSIVFDDVPGVGPGTPVRRSGVRIGEVKSVDLDDETGKVHVGILVEKRHQLRQSDQATLVRRVLGGDTTIDFLPRKAAGQPPDNTPIEPGAELPGAPGPDVMAVLNQTSELVPSTAETLNEIRKSMQRFDRLTPLLEETARAYRDLARSTSELLPEVRRTNTEIQGLAKAARETVPEIRNTNTELQGLARSSRELVPELRRSNEEIQVTARNWGKLGERLDVLVQTNEDKAVKALENFNDTVVRVGKLVSDENQRNVAATLKNARAGSENLDSISRNAEAFLKESRQSLQELRASLRGADEVLANLQKATKPMADRGPGVMKNLDESSDKLNRLLDGANELMRSFRGTEGTLNRFLNDPALYNNLNDAACMTVRMLPRLDRILHDMEVFTDKIARHPESLGLGGVVVPSSGLKESPFSNSSYHH
jgi:ABC-type transporter Mla subunit MlaD